MWPSASSGRVPAAVAGLDWSDLFANGPAPRRFTASWGRAAAPDGGVAKVASGPAGEAAVAVTGDFLAFAPSNGSRVVIVLKFVRGSVVIEIEGMNPLGRSCGSSE